MPRPASARKICRTNALLIWSPGLNRGFFFGETATYLSLRLEMPNAKELREMGRRACCHLSIASTSAIVRLTGAYVFFRLGADAPLFPPSPPRALDSQRVRGFLAFCIHNGNHKKLRQYETTHRLGFCRGITLPFSRHGHEAPKGVPRPSLPLCHLRGEAHRGSRF